MDFLNGIYKYVLFQKGTATLKTEGKAKIRQKFQKENRVANLMSM